ncbi:acetylserotonin O-methyltransferase [Cellulophaga sp. F20128]|uniref:acetylserotonin O-methyltransferase n=1 Tax=Cellulophaga sp. F20128 TaxID=2926413 RepID=UPI001FF3C306|nr:acetylserotonin O-methyltransferase [Cellulophaga sp. F20128]MCK0157656.1 acetylserotonin O-methyltransferase [Cellulophaga sp. F20128]
MKTTALVDPSKIMQIGMGFFASKTMLTAVNLGLFTHLAKAGLTGQSIKEKLGLHTRGLYDFLDTLVALGFLKRTGIKETAVYNNAEDADLFLDKNKPSYIGGMLEMANNRLYPFWNNLEEGLKTGKPQNETKTGNAPIFEAIYADQSRLREFLSAMGGIQIANFQMLSKVFDFKDYHTLCDAGGAGGYLAAQVAINNKHMRCITFDLPPVEPVARENINRMGLSDRVTVQSGDFLTEDLPKADVITMGNVLHDWGTKEKKALIKKAYKALPQGGALVVIENIIDDNRSENAFGLMMSLNMNIETSEGFDFSAADFNGWARECGFTQTSIIPLTGPSSAVIAIK